MTSSIHFPGPRDGLDEGSLAELAQVGGEIEVDVAQPPPSAPATDGSPSDSTNVAIDVPDDAYVMIDGLAAYGA